MSDLRDRIAAVLRTYRFCNSTAEEEADAVIEELDLGIPCAANGCKMRKIAREAAQKSPITKEDK